MASPLTVHEHHHFEKATEALKVEKLTKSPGEIPVELWEKAIDFIRNFADKCHHLKEEGLLFPALEEHGIPREGGPIGMMLFEHEEGRGYVKAMVTALSHAKQDPQAARTELFQNARAYLRLLREHIAKEDQVLFEMVDSALTPEEQKKLLREFDEHEEKELGAGIHEKYLAIAKELEDRLG